MTTQIEVRGNEQFDDVNRNNANRGDVNRKIKRPPSMRHELSNNSFQSEKSSFILDFEGMLHREALAKVPMMK